MGLQLSLVAQRLASGVQCHIHIQLLACCARYIHKYPVSLDNVPDFKFLYTPIVGPYSGPDFKHL